MCFVITVSNGCLTLCFPIYIGFPKVCTTLEHVTLWKVCLVLCGCALSQPSVGLCAHVSVEYVLRVFIYHQADQRLRSNGRCGSYSWSTSSLHTRPLWDSQGLPVPKVFVKPKMMLLTFPILLYTLCRLSLSLAPISGLHGETGEP